MDAKCCASCVRVRKNSSCLSCGCLYFCPTRATSTALYSGWCFGRSIRSSPLVDFVSNSSIGIFSAPRNLCRIGFANRIIVFDAIRCWHWRCAQRTHMVCCIAHVGESRRSTWGYFAEQYRCQRFSNCGSNHRGNSLRLRRDISGILFY